MESKVFGRKKENTPTQAPAHETELLPADSRRKTGPTPSRKQAQKKNYRPVVSNRAKMTKQERKAYDKELRAKRDEEWRIEQTAMKTGDVKNMPLAHRGEERSFARDYIDARITLSSFFMPLAIVLVLLLFIQARWPMVFLIATSALYVIFGIMVLDSYIAARQARLLVEHKFGAKRVPARLTVQMFGRTFYPHRYRLPKPQVSTHQYPDGGTPDDIRAARAQRRENKKIMRGKA